MGPRVGLDGEKCRPTRIRSPDRPALSSVAIPTELSDPALSSVDVFIHYTVMHNKSTIKIVVLCITRYGINVSETNIVTDIVIPDFAQSLVFFKS